MDPKRQHAAHADVYPPYKPVPAIIPEGSPLYEGPNVVAVSEDGRETVVPSVPYEWWIDTDGNAVALVVSTNRDENDREERYGKLERDRRHFLGWKPFTAFETDEERSAYMADLKAKVEARTRSYSDVTKNPAELFGENAGKAIERVLGEFAQRERAAKAGKAG